MSARGIEFVLDHKYHKAKYLENTTSQMKIVVDGLPMTINMHQNLNEIVFKNSGDTGGGDSQISLHSQIPDAQSHRGGNSGSSHQQISTKLSDARDHQYRADRR